MKKLFFTIIVLMATCTVWAQEVSMDSTTIASTPQEQKISNKQAIQALGRNFKSWMQKHVCSKSFVMTEVSMNLADNVSNESKIGVVASYNYRVTPWWSVGLGLGVEFYYSRWFYTDWPLFIQNRINFNTKWKPFIDLKTGYSVYDNWGHYIKPSFGIRQSLSKKMDISLGVGYQLFKSEGCPHQNTVSIGVGLEF